MDSTKKITFVDKNGNEKTATILLYFKLTEFNKEYVVYTLGEEANDLEKVYTSTIVKNDDGIVLETIETDEEWLQIKQLMKTIIKSNRE